MATCCSVADALARVLDGATPLPAEAARRSPMRTAACWPPTSRRCAPSRRPICPPWTAMRCAPRASRSAGDAQGDRRGRGRASVRRQRRRRRSGAHLHRRRGAARRRHHRDPGEHQARRRPRHGHRRRGRRAGTSAAPGSISSKAQVLLAKGRRLTDRDLMLAAAMNHPDRAGAPPARASRCSAPATNWCRRARRPGPARSSIPTASR